MKKIYLLTTILGLILLAFGCADVQDEIVVNETTGVHPEGFGKPGDADFHSVWFKENNWDLISCQKCHAANYAGGTAETSCLSCHAQSAGPEACNTCHGDFSDPERIAPPSDLSDNIATTARGVGAHTTHVYENGFRENIGCYECHPSETGSDKKYVYAHVGTPPADIEFGDFSSKSGEPTYDFSGLTCADTYCHGNYQFKKENSEFQWVYADSLIQGENFTPVWNKVDDTQAECGTCHLLPPKGHLNAGNDPSATSCGSSGCHLGIVSAEGKIIDKGLHINGEANGGIN